MQLCISYTRRAAGNAKFTVVVSTATVMAVIFQVLNQAASPLHTDNRGHSLNTPAIHRTPFSTITRHSLIARCGDHDVTAPLHLVLSKKALDSLKKNREIEIII